MKLDLRVRRLEGHMGPEPIATPLAEWASTLPIEDVRALRDYLRDITEDATTGSASAQRHERAVALLAVAPEEVRQSLGLAVP